MKSSIINARIDSKRKTHVEKIFKKLGLTHAQAINLFYAQVEINEALPFSIAVAPTIKQKNSPYIISNEPNSETIASFNEAE